LENVRVEWAKQPKPSTVTRRTGNPARIEDEGGRGFMPISNNRDRTKVISMEQPGVEQGPREILQRVYLALQEKGYNPVAQIAGYLLCGDPVYITTHRDARTLIRQLNLQEVMEELVRYYIEGR